MEFFSLLYLESPATSEEEAVANLLQKLVRSFREKNIETLAGVYSPKARINSLHDKKNFISRQEYLQLMRGTMETIRDVSFTHVLVRILGEKALISCLSNTLLRGKATHMSNRRQFSCIKEAGEWKIVEAIFL